MSGAIFDGDFWTRTAERARPLAELDYDEYSGSTEQFHTPAILTDAADLNASRIPPGQIEGPKYLNNYRPKFDEGDFSQILLATKWIGELSGCEV